MDSTISFQLAEVIYVVSQHTGLPALDSDQIMQPTVDVLGKILEAKWMIAGDIAEDPEGRLRVDSWDLDPSATLRLMLEEWWGLNHPPNLGDVVWFELTEKGRAHARSFED